MRASFHFGGVLMRISSIDYSSKATKLIAALMVCILIFTFVVPAQEADAAAGVALAAGLTLAFVAACGVAFTVNEAQNSSTYWEGQIDSYLTDSGFSDVGEWIDFGSVVYDSASGTLRYPGALIRSLLNFFDWFTGKNEITASSEVEISYAPYGYLEDESTGTIFYMGHCRSVSSNNTLDQSNFSFGSLSISPTNTGYDTTFTFNGHTIRIYIGNYFQYWIDGTAHIGAQTQYISSNISMAICENYGTNSIDALGALYVNTDGSAKFVAFGSAETYGLASGLSYTATGSDVLGLPDLDEKETELGYVPDVSIPLPETVAEDTNIGDANDAATAVLDYAGTAGNTLDLEYEYVNEDTNVDTDTDTETDEGTQEGAGTDTETGTQAGSVTLENVAADSLVEVAPETMLEDDTLLGLFVSKFPWCIPFDLYFAVSAFAADPVAPEFEIDLFEGVSWGGIDFSDTTMVLSFDIFERVAAVVRWSTLIVFCGGLAMITKRMIWK